WHRRTDCRVCGRGAGSCDFAAHVAHWSAAACVRCAARVSVDPSPCGAFLSAPCGSGGVAEHLFSSHGNCRLDWNVCHCAEFVTGRTTGWRAHCLCARAARSSECFLGGDCGASGARDLLLGGVAPVGSSPGFDRNAPSFGAGIPSSEGTPRPCPFWAAHAGPDVCGSSYYQQLSSASNSANPGCGSVMYGD